MGGGGPPPPLWVRGGAGGGTRIGASGPRWQPRSARRRAPRRSRSRVPGLRAPRRGVRLLGRGDSPGLIGRAHLDGTGREPRFITADRLPSGVAVDAPHLLAHFGPPGHDRARQPGRHRRGPGLHHQRGDRPCAVAVDAVHVYWANNSGRGDVTIGRANFTAREEQDSSPPDRGSRPAASRSTRHHVLESTRGGRSPAPTSMAQAGPRASLPDIHARRAAGGRRRRGAHLLVRAPRGNRPPQRSAAPTSTARGSE